jgi:hypothetical protein
MLPMRESPPRPTTVGEEVIDDLRRHPVKH